MRLLICAGGTGGGVYPALSILQALGNRAESVLWVGGKDGMEASLVSRYQLPYAEISAAGVHGVGLRALPGNLWKLLRGYREARAILKQFKPDVILFTGGYLAIPMALAATHFKTLLYVPDIEPGLALKTLAGLADVIALTTDTSKKYFKSRKNLVVTGYPTRTDLVSTDRESARKLLGLKLDSPVLLVMGGSKGARSINNALLKTLPDLLLQAQVIHISGELDWAEVRKNTEMLEPALKQRYHLYPFLHEEMGPAFASADLVVARAGASTLGELPLFGLPAILIPYPFAWRYQKVNADFLVEHGAAVLLTNDELDANLQSSLEGLLGNAEKLTAMNAKMRALATPNAAKSVAQLLVDLSSQPGKVQGI